MLNSKVHKLTFGVKSKESSFVSGVDLISISSFSKITQMGLSSRMHFHPWQALSFSVDQEESLIITC